LFFNLSLQIAKCEFSAPKAPRTPLRFKLLSLKPNKQKLVLGRVTVSVDPPAAAPPTTAANDSSSSTSSNVMLGATAGATIGTGISASMASSSSSSSSGQLSGILQTAMLQMDTKVILTKHAFFRATYTIQLSTFHNIHSSLAVSSSSSSSSLFYLYVIDNSTN